MNHTQRMNRIDENDRRLSIARQCELVGISRSSYYVQASSESPLNLEPMRRIDRRFLQTPFFGSRQMMRWLRRQGHLVDRKRAMRLMRLMGLMPIYQASRTSSVNADHPVYPYLLRDLTIDRPNQSWCADITYIPMQRGFLYLVAIMDWHRRKVLSWRLSNTLDTSFCTEALAEAFDAYHCPSIFNTDQGSQFTSQPLIDTVKRSGAMVSMDGKGRWMDNVFIERRWRSLKYECVYLNLPETGKQARTQIGPWIVFYNTQRPHSPFDGHTPDEVYHGLSIPSAEPVAA